MISPLLVTLLLAVPALSNPLVERNQCYRDNVLRALVNTRNIDEAVKFCSTYITVPPVTRTVSNIPPDCPTRTAITVVIDPLPPTTITTTPTNTITVTAATTVYSTYAAPHYKRDYGLPPFVSQYPPSRVSSACSCLTITPTTTTSTQTTCPPPNTVVVTQAPPRITVTVTAQSVVITSHYTTTRTLPALCKPTNFKEYRGGVIPQPVKLQQTTGQTETDCCVTCFNAKDCGYFQFRPDNSPAARCEYYIGTAPTDPSPYKDICPLGVAKTSELDSPAGVGSGQYLLNYGPCLAKSPLRGCEFYE